MAVFAVAVVRDEADIIARTVTQMAEQVDHVVVADNGSTDGTRDILNDLGIEVRGDRVRGFYQAHKITRLALEASERGADWVVPFDGDEMWYAPPGRTIADVLASQPADIDVVGAVFWDHVATDDDDLDEPDPIRRMVWREMGNGGLLRIAARCKPGLIIEDGNHFASYGDDPFSFAWPQLAVRHFSLRSLKQFKAKARKCIDGLNAADLHPAIADHWRSWAPAVEAGDEALEAIWNQRLHLNPERDYSLIRDPAPLAVT